MQLRAAWGHKGPQSWWHASAWQTTLSPADIHRCGLSCTFHVLAWLLVALEQAPSQPQNQSLYYLQQHRASSEHWNLSSQQVIRSTNFAFSPPMLLPHPLAPLELHSNAPRCCSLHLTGHGKQMHDLFVGSCCQAERIKRDAPKRQYECSLQQACVNLAASEQKDASSLARLCE